MIFGNWSQSLILYICQIIVYRHILIALNICEILLTDLYLAEGMIGDRRDFHRLGNFPQLEDIRISDNIINGLFDCEKHLMYAPKTLITVDFGRFRLDENMIGDDSSSDDHNSHFTYNTAFKYSQIEELAFRGYFPQDR